MDTNVVNGKTENAPYTYDPTRATRKQKYLAKLIAERLDLALPETEDKEAYRAFISEHKDRYTRQKIQDGIDDIERKRQAMEAMRYRPQDDGAPPVPRPGKRKKPSRKGAISQKQEALVLQEHPHSRKAKQIERKYQKERERVMAKANELELKLANIAVGKDENRAAIETALYFAKECGPVLPWTVEKVAERIDIFFARCAETGTIPDVAGLACAFCVSSATMRNWMNGGGKCEETPEIVEMLNFAKTIAEHNLEQQTLKGVVSTPGGIFALKQHGWRDEQETVVVHTAKPLESREELLKQAGILPIQEAEKVEVVK